MSENDFQDLVSRIRDWIILADSNEEMTERYMMLANAFEDAKIRHYEAMRRP
jgi:hypothetical protein